MSAIRSTRRTTVLAAALAIFALFALPASGLAQTVGPTDEQYGLGILEETAAGDPAAGAAGAEVSTAGANGDGVSELPFTGLDLVAIAAMSLGLLGAGLLLRRTAGGALR